MPNIEPDPVPEHCTACGSTSPEDTDLDAGREGYSACCNEPVCSGPLLVDLTFRTPRRYPAAPCCATDPRYCPAIASALREAGVRYVAIQEAQERDHYLGLQKERPGRAALELVLDEDLPPEELRRALAALRGAGWTCRPERIDAVNAMTVVRVAVGPQPPAVEQPPVLVYLDRVLQLAGFTPYRFEQAEAFWGYRADLVSGGAAGAVHVTLHGPDGLGMPEGAAESLRQTAAAQQALRDARWSVRPALGHSFHASAPAA